MFEEKFKGQNNSNWRYYRHKNTIDEFFDDMGDIIYSESNYAEDFVEEDSNKFGEESSEEFRMFEVIEKLRFKYEK